MKNHLATPAGLPEYAENVNSRRLAAMQEARGAAFRRAFPTEKAQLKYGAERLAYITPADK